MDQKKCEGCSFWRSQSGYSTSKCCHYLLDTGNMRAEKDGECLSRLTARRKRKKDPFEVPLKQR